MGYRTLTIIFVISLLFQGWGLARLLSHATAIGLLREDPSHKKYDDEDNERS
jgi:hypothetical protein